MSLCCEGRWLRWLALPSAPQKMWIALFIYLGLLGVTFQTDRRSLFVSAFAFHEEPSSGLPAPGPLTGPPSERGKGHSGGHPEPSVCLESPSLDPELRRMCMMAVDHLAALYRRLTVEYEIKQQLSPEEVLSAISERLDDILAEEDHVADLVIAKKLPHGALPVRSLKQAIQAKLEALHRLKPKNITTKPGLMGLEIHNGKLQGIGDCVEAQVIFFYDLTGSKFKLAKMTDAEVAELAAKLTATFSMATLDKADLPGSLAFIARAVMDEVLAPARAESLGAALQAMPPFTPVGDDNGLSPLSPSRCLTLVRGLFPTLRAHMTLHYEMIDPTEEQLQAMSNVLLPIVNAHRSRLRLSAQKGVTLLAPEEHTILWGYMEQYAREHKLVGRERPLNLWRFPNPAGAANLLD